MSRTALTATAAFLAIATALPAYAAENVKDATVVTMSEPTLSVIPYGKASRVSGIVSGVVDPLSTQEGRSVRLELSTPNGWMPLRAKDVTGAEGEYSVKVPSSWYYRGKVRTTVDESGTHLKGTSLTTESVTVKPPYAPKGKPSSWSHLFPDTDVRWNPCRVITFKVNPTGGPEKAVSQVKQALRRVAAATGLRFDYKGRTNAIPFRTDGKRPAFSETALTISWATPEQVKDLRDGVAGWGGGLHDGREITRGGIALDRTGTSFVENGFGKGPTWGALLMHELGHVLGLGHTSATEQVMYSSILPTTVGRFGAGDLAGLSDQGAMGGCIPSAGAKRTASEPQRFATY